MDTKECLGQVLITLFAVIVTCSLVFAQEAPPDITITPLPVGSGARAIGQGGAFTAVADDATAASWNPAGLTQLVRPEFSIVSSYITTLNDFTFNPTLTLGDERTSRGDINYLSIVYPFNLWSAERNFVASLNYQQVFDFDMDLTFDWNILSPNEKVTDHVNFESKGGVGALSPAFAFQVSRTLSFGAAVNFYTDEFFGKYAWEEDLEIRGRSTDFDTCERSLFATKDEDIFRNFQAVNATLGMLWRVWEKEEKRFTLGLTLDLPYEAHVDRELKSSSITINRDPNAEHATKSFRTNGDVKRSEFEIDFPMSITAGIAYNHSDALHFSLDLTWTDWSRFNQKDEAGIRSLPIGGVPASEESIDDTISVRCGAEYRILKELKDKVLTFPLRGGLFYEPRPSLGAPADFIGFSLGTGITFADKIYEDSGLTYTRDRFSIDFAYQLRYGDNINGEDIGITGTKFDVTDQLFLISFIYYF